MAQTEDRISFLLIKATKKIVDEWKLTIKKVFLCRKNKKKNKKQVWSADNLCSFE
jgi:hypothetical protein